MKLYGWGRYLAEAGVLLGDAISVILHRGWFPLVTPGTKLVTFGDVIAADVHGINHHKEGSFRECVQSGWARKILSSQAERLSI